jgi:hypothetical protein
VMVRGAFRRACAAFIPKTRGEVCKIFANDRHVSDCSDEAYMGWSQIIELLRIRCACTFDRVAVGSVLIQVETARCKQLRRG